MNIIGLDISLCNTGYTIYDTKIKKFVKTGSISTTSQESMHTRLSKIHQKITQLQFEYNTKKAFIEEAFVNPKRPSSTMQVLKATGVVLLALGDIPISFQHNSTMKKDVTGYGRADKSVVQEHILKKYNYLKFKNEDESDAVAAIISGLKLFNN